MPDSIVKYQQTAGRLLAQICAVSGTKPSEFCDILSKFLGDIDVQTVQAYFRKLPYKYIVPEDGYALFSFAIENTIAKLCSDNPYGAEAGKIAEQNWKQHGEALLVRMAAVHKRAFTLNFEENLQKIDEFLAD